MKTFVPLLRDQGRNVRIVAPTGKAALDINGSTTWTYAGWTPGHFKQPLSELLKAAHGKFVNRRFKDTDVLVIDEISMVENHLLQRLDAVMKEARGNMKAFGGVQLVVTGEFLSCCGINDGQELTMLKRGLLPAASRQTVSILHVLWKGSNAADLGWQDGL